MEEIMRIFKKFGWDYSREIYAFIKEDKEVHVESALFLHKNKKLEEYLKELESKK